MITPVYLCNDKFSASLDSAGHIYVQSIGDSAPSIRLPLRVKQIALTSKHCILLTHEGQVFASDFSQITKAGHVPARIDEGMFVQQILAFQDTVYFLLATGIWRCRSYQAKGVFFSAGWSNFNNQHWNTLVSNEPVLTVFSLHDICFIVTTNRLWVKTTHPFLYEAMEGMISQQDTSAALSAQKFVPLQLPSEILVSSIQSIAIGAAHILLYTQRGEYVVGKLSEFSGASSFTNIDSLTSRSGSPSSASYLSKSTVSLDSLHSIETMPMVQFYNSSLSGQMPVKMGPWDNNIYSL